MYKRQYIDTVDVQKRLFPPSVKVTVTEYTPSAYIIIDGKTLLVNSELRVLTDTGDVYKRQVQVKEENICYLE